MRLVAAVNTVLDAELVGARGVRGAHDCPTGAAHRRARGWAGAAGGRCSGRRSCHCPSPRTVVVLGPVAGAVSDLQHAGGVAALWAPGRRRVGAALADVVARHESLRTVFPAADGVPAAGGGPPRGPISVGRLSMPRIGRRAGWLRPSGRDAVTPSTWPPRSPCGQGFSVLTTTNMCWWPWCTISPPMAGRSTPLVRDLGVAYASRCTDRLLSGHRLAVQYVDYTLWQRALLGDLADPAAGSPRSWRTGKRRWLGCRIGCTWLPIGRIRRSLITAEPGGGGLAGGVAAAGRSGGA